jgi:hypothetical protein
MLFEEPGKEIYMKERSRKNDRVGIFGIELEWKLRRNDTVDQYCVLAATMPPGVGVPVHQHPQQEAFLCLPHRAKARLSILRKVVILSVR